MAAGAGCGKRREQMAATEDGKGRRDRLRRRLPGWLLLVGMALLAGRYLARQPSELTVVFHLGATRAGLRRLEARYLRGEEVVRRVSFRYQRRDAPQQQPHTVKLLDGSYQVLVDLTYGEVVPPAIRTRKERVGPSAVRLRRSLSVDGPGRLTIFIADEL